MCRSDEFAHSARLLEQSVLVGDGELGNTYIYPNLVCRYQQVLADLSGRGVDH